MVATFIGSSTKPESEPTIRNETKYSFFTQKKPPLNEADFFKIKMSLVLILIGPSMFTNGFNHNISAVFCFFPIELDGVIMIRFRNANVNIFN